MPELPDVERFGRVLVVHAAGERISRVEVRDAGVVRGRSSADFRRRVEGRTFAQPARLGKWLLARTDGPTILFHFGMTGGLSWAGSPAAGAASDSPVVEDHFVRVVFEMDSGRLLYRDQRKLRGLWLARDDEEIAAVIGRQGPDALGLSGAELKGRLAGHRGGLKAVLMDQTVIAGLGNMLSDEVLWRARVHPGHPFASLDDEGQRRLGRTLQTVLRACIKQERIPRSRSWLSSQRGAEDARCPRCHSRLRTSRLAGRTSYWCPICQPAPTDTAGGEPATRSPRTRRPA